VACTTSLDQAPVPPGSPPGAAWSRAIVPLITSGALLDGVRYDRGASWGIATRVDVH